MIPLFLGVVCSVWLLAGGNMDSGTSGITVVTCNGSVGQKTELLILIHLWCGLHPENNDITHQEQSFPGPPGKPMQIVRAM